MAEKREIKNKQKSQIAEAQKITHEEITTFTVVKAFGILKHGIAWLVDDFISKIHLILNVISSQYPV